MLQKTDDCVGIKMTDERRKGRDNEEVWHGVVRARICPVCVRGVRTKMRISVPAGCGDQLTTSPYREPTEDMRANMATLSASLFCSSLQV